jgi:DNA-binding IclR family transcriptional regulator
VKHSIPVDSGVGVLDKAVVILDALSGGPLALNELAAATGLPKPTLHRLCGALEAHELLDRTSDDRRRLGGRLARWAYAADADHEQQLVEVAEPFLRRLRDETEESVQLYVRDGDQRRCIAGLESPHGLRTIVQVGELLPLEAGSAGAVLREAGATRRRRWVQSVEERERGVASVSAPVMAGDQVVGALSVSGPIDRTGRSLGRKYGPILTEIAHSLSTHLTN